MRAVHTRAARRRHSVPLQCVRCGRGTQASRAARRVLCDARGVRGSNGSKSVHMREMKRGHGIEAAGSADSNHMIPRREVRHGTRSAMPRVQRAETVNVALRSDGWSAQTPPEFWYASGLYSPPSSLLTSPPENTEVYLLTYDMIARYYKGIRDEVESRND